MIRGLLLACAAFAPPSRLLLRQAPHAASRAQPIVAQFPGLPLPPGLTAPLSARGAVPCPTDIAVTGFNSRTISANIVIEAAPSAVWQILTDYDRLSSHVPNLVSSYRVPHPRDGIRLYQEGAQNIAGFQFGASLTMDMEETTDDGQREPNRIKFKLVESKMFASFDGEWRMQVFSRRKGPDGGFIYKTKLYYRVAITPKGLVPVPAVRRRPPAVVAAPRRRRAPRDPPTDRPPRRPAARVADTRGRADEHARREGGRRETQRERGAPPVEGGARPECVVGVV